MSQIGLSVVIPTHNENDDTYLPKIVATYPELEGIEYIVADEGSDLTFLISVKRSDFKVLRTDKRTRAGRLNMGLEAAQGEMILFHHPRSLLPSEALKYLLLEHQKLSWGGFTHQFDKKHWGLLFTSWYSNKVRPKLSQIVYLDHCIFFRKDLLKKPLPDIPIFEDTELSLLLRKSGKPKILSFPSVTSSVRFERNGFLKQALMNQKLKIQYHWGSSRQKMNSEYESKLNLNG